MNRRQRLEKTKEKKTTKKSQGAYYVCNLNAALRFSLIKPGMWDQKVQTKNRFYGEMNGQYVVISFCLLILFFIDV